MDYQSLKSKAIAVKSNLQLYESQLSQAKLKEQELVSTIHQLQQDIFLYDKSITTLKSVIDKLSQSHIEHLNNLLNTALSTIFFDRQYSVTLNVTDLRNNKNLEILLNEKLPTDEVLTTKLDDNGYGVKSIIGFILQVYFIIYHKQSPVLFMDEAFSNLSTQYLPYLKELINQLSQRYNFTFVLITHDERLSTLAERKYSVNLGDVQLC